MDPSLPCPAPAECHSLHRIFGSAARCSPDLELGGRLDLSDALIISCPITASYLKRRTLHLRSGVGLGFSPPCLFLERKKILPVTNGWGCKLGQDSSSLCSDYISSLAEFIFLRAKGTSYAKKSRCFLYLQQV